jgi:hypothetical protein
MTTACVALVIIGIGLMFLAWALCRAGKRADEIENRAFLEYLKGGRNG